MTIADQLLEASFAGVRFLVPQERETGGRKAAIHEYPNSDERFVEDLGRRLAVFSITAIVHGFDAVPRRARLTAALNAGAGILVHPYIGSIPVNPLDFTVTTSDRNLGEVIYEIEFVQTAEAFGLLADAGGLQGVFSAAADARQALDDAVTSRYSPLTIQNSIQKLGSRVLEGLSSIQTTTAQLVNPTQDALNEFTRQTNAVRSSALSIVRTPQRLTTAVRGVFTTVLGLAETPADLRREWAILTNFGAPSRFLSSGQRSVSVGPVRVPISRTTLKRQTEDDNLRIVDQYIRIEALINSFESEADADFATDIELEATRQRLADDFDRIIRNQDDVIATSNIGDEILTDSTVFEPSATVSEAEAFANSVAFDPALKDALDNLRVTAFQVLSDDAKNPFRVDTF